MSSSQRKATRYLQSLNTALSLENYGEVPELSRKVRKHDPTRTCFAHSAEVQALLLRRLRTSQRSVDDANLNDTRGLFHWLVLDALSTSAEKALLDKAYAAHQTANSEDRAYYDVTNLFYGIAIRRLDAASSLLSQILTDACSSHLAQIYALTGILQELLCRPQEALEQYLKCPNTYTKAVQTESPLWFEHVLYRLAILAPTSQNYDNFMAYMSRKGDSDSSKVLHVMSTREDSGAYSEALLRHTRFPPADATNVRLLDQVTHVLDAWLEGGSNPLQAEKHLELLYEAGSKTFHSPRVLRYMIHALAALERYDEVFLALNAYLQIAFHAQKTQPGGDIDPPALIIGTVHFVVTTVLKRVPTGLRPDLEAEHLHARIVKVSTGLHLEDSCCISMISEIHGVAKLLRYHEAHERLYLREAVTALETAIQIHPTAQGSLALSFAHLQSGEMLDAMGCVRQSLQLDPESIPALLLFANLLCCEELYERASLVLEKILGLPQSRDVAEHRANLLLTAKLMQIKILEQTDGSAKALERTPELLASFKHFFGPITSGIQNGHAHGDRTESIHEKITQPSRQPSEAPTIRIDTVSQQNPVPFLAPQPSEAFTPHEKSPNGARLQPISNPHQIEKARSASNPSRSSSLKVDKAQRGSRHHLHLRKSASVRSLRAQDTFDDSSRSSSPLNHPAPSLHSIIPDVEPVQDMIELDTQMSAVDLHNIKRRRILADIWLFIAHLCQASDAPAGDIEQAIEEARLLVGQTPEIITKQLEVRVALASVQGRLSEDMLDVVEQGYDFALDLDDGEETTILSFANFLMREEAQQSPLSPSSEVGLERQVGRLARAYDLLESLKLGPGAANPRLWQLSADIAVRRGEFERAEEEYWKAVEASDIRGLVDWYRLW